MEVLEPEGMGGSVDAVKAEGGQHKELRSLDSRVLSSEDSGYFQYIYTCMCVHL